MEARTALVQWKLLLTTESRAVPSLITIQRSLGYNDVKSESKLASFSESTPTYGVLSSHAHVLVL